MLPAATLLALRLPTLSLRGWVAQTRAIVRQRQALATLDAARLADLGLTQQQARAEAQRPFWDAPTQQR